MVFCHRIGHSRAGVIERHYGYAGFAYRDPGAWAKARRRLALCWPACFPSEAAALRQRYTTAVAALPASDAAGRSCESGLAWGGH